ncbi:MAG: sugar ABC transporter permease [Caldilineaceae bacterium]
MSSIQLKQQSTWLRLPRVRRREWQGLLYIAPWLIGFLVFIVYPFIWSIQLSFMDWKGIGTPKFIGLENYVTLFTDDEAFLISIRNTLVYTFVHVPGVMILAFLVALLLNERVRFMPLFRTLFYLPSVTSGVATVVLWVWILHPTGLLNRALGLFGITGPNWFGSTTWALPGLILMSLWNIGGNMVIYLAGLQGVPQQLYDASEIDGANAWQRVRYVTLPMMTPSIFLTLILGIIGSFQVFTAALVATEGGPGYATLFILLHIYYNAFRYFRMGYASALAWVLFVIIMIFTLIQFSLASRWVYYEGEQRS